MGACRLPCGRHHLQPVPCLGVRVPGPSRDKPLQKVPWQKTFLYSHTQAGVYCHVHRTHLSAVFSCTRPAFLAGPASRTFPATSAG